MIGHKNVPVNTFFVDHEHCEVQSNSIKTTN